MITHNTHQRGGRTMTKGGAGGLEAKCEDTDYKAMGWPGFTSRAVKKKKEK